METIELNSYNIALITIGTLKYSSDDPREEEFWANVPEIFDTAKKSKGFVWRYIFNTEEEVQAVNKLFKDDLIVTTLSVWKTIDDAFNFAYKSKHMDIFRRRKDWFITRSDAKYALWWIKKGENPTHEEGKEKLDLLNMKGPTQEAFTFKKCFPRPERHFTTLTG